MGIILEEFEIAKQSLAACKGENLEKENIVKDFKGRVTQLQADIFNLEDTHREEVDEYKKVIESQETHIGNLEAEKHPSRLKAYIIGIAIGLGVGLGLGAVIVGASK